MTQRIDIVALPLGFGAHRLGLFNGGETQSQVFRRRRRVRIVRKLSAMPQWAMAHRIRLEDFLEDLLGLSYQNEC